MVWGGNIAIMLTHLALLISYSAIYLFVYWDKASLCIPGYPKMLSKNQARLRIIEIHLLELKACVSTSGYIFIL